jgi:hypothetical protein
MGAASNLSKIAFDCLGHGCSADRFTLVAESREQARDAIIGEASYALLEKQVTLSTVQRAAASLRSRSSIAGTARP